MSDSIANFITALTNAGAVGKPMVTVPHSSLIEHIAETLEKEGYVVAVTKKGKKTPKQLEVTLLYVEGVPRIRGTKRVSKLSRRVYLGAKDIKSVRGGFGALIVTTPEGVMTGKKAREKGVGGEALFEIW